MLGGSISIFIVGWMITHPQPSFQAALQAVALWWQWLAPSLFPALFFSWLIFFFIFDNIRTIVMHNIKFATIGTIVLLGFPAAAPLLRRMYMNQKISKQELEAMVGGCFVHNPMWLFVVLMICGQTLTITQTMIIAISYLMSVLTVAIVALRLQPTIIGKTEPLNHSTRSIGSILSNATKLSGTTTLYTGGVTLFIAVIAAMVANLMQITPVLGNWFTQSHVFMLADVHQSILDLTRLQSQIPAHSFFVTGGIAMTLAWGGLSMHLLVKMTLYDVDFSYRRFVYLRLFQVAVAAMSVFLMMHFIDI
jgi:hypothetical protein